MTSTSTRTERIAGVARLWGAIRGFHPWIARGDIDWDGALTDALPAVLGATDNVSYRAAVEGLLAHLGDPGTRVIEVGAVPVSWPTDTESESALPAGPPSIKTVDGPAGTVGILEARQLAALGPVELLQAVPGLLADLAKTKAIVFDARGGGYLVPYYGLAYVAALFEGDVALPVARTRMHVGHAPDAGGAEMYYSAFVVPDAKVITGTGGKLAKKPLVFILDEHAAFQTHAFGLQAAGRAKVVWTGPFTDAAGVDIVRLPDDITVLFRTADSVTPNGGLGITPDALVDSDENAGPTAMDAAIQLAVRGKKRATKTAPAPLARQARRKPDPSNPYPPVEERLLGLFHYWNTIDYHFPYRDLMDRDWDDVLAEFIPRVEEAKDATEYALAMAECNANINDTHGFFYCDAFGEWLGTHSPPMQVRLVQGSTVVTRIDEPIEGLAVGDIVLAVDGEKAADRRARLTKYFAASTPQALEWRLHNALLGGAEQSHAVLDIERADGTSAEVRAARTTPQVMPSERDRPVFEVVPQGYGYIDLARLTLAQTAEALAAVQQTPALIFDMRGYPNGTAGVIAARLATERAVAAQFRKPIPRNAGRDVTTVEFMHQHLETAPDSPRYEGAVVTLIYSESISQAEHTCLFIEAATKGEATFIGSPTNGANGDVTSIVMPGGLRAMFSGHDVRHADGSQLQRKGIQPHIHVEPTIAGIREGRDEVLDAAIEFLEAGGQR